MSGKGDERPKSLPQQQLQKLESSCSFCNNPFNAALHSKATLPQPFCFGDCMCMGMPPQSSAANRCMRRGKLLTVHCLSKAQSFPLQPTFVTHPGLRRVEIFPKIPTNCQRILLGQSLAFPRLFREQQLVVEFERQKCHFVENVFSWFSLSAELIVTISYAVSFSSFPFQTNGLIITANDQLLRTV